MNLKIITLLLLLFSSNIPLLSSSVEKESTDISKSENNSKVDFLDIDYFQKGESGFYIIGPGDTLYIDISPFYPELITSTTINGQGFISLPSLGKVYVKDLSVNELKSLLNKSYKKFVKYPSVAIEIIGYRPITIFIDGEVNTPGIHTLVGAMSDEFNKRERDLLKNFSNKSILKNSNDELDRNSIFKNDNKSDQLKLSKINYFFPRLFDVLKSSGGITRFADLSSIKLVRKNKISDGGGRIVSYLNLEELLISGDNTQNIRIYDGDSIFVKKSDNPNFSFIKKAIKSNLNSKLINVFISGRVNNPGLLTLARSSTLNDAIDMAGGKVLKGPIQYMSIKNDGTLEKREIRYRKRSRRGSKNNPFLNDGDFIVINNSLVTSSAEVINEITSPLQGIYSGFRLFQLFSD